MLKYRIITALILVPIVIALTIKLPPIGFCIFTGVIVLAGAWEWGSFLGLTKGLYKLVYILFFLSLLILCFELPVIYILFLSLIWWLIALILVLFYPKLSTLWNHNVILRAIMGFFVLIPCWLAINYLRNSEDGLYILLYLFVIIWGADTAAYFIGKKWGKHKLAPAVSPGKTWQGLFAALVMTIVLSMVALIMFKAPREIWIFGILLSVVTVLFSILGDLFESMLKRNVGLKDSGHLLPGHGGLLDRIDSLTAAAPIFALGATIIGKFFS